MKNFEFLGHTADIRLRVYGKDFESLFMNAAKGLYSLMECRYADGQDKEATEVEVSADSAENLLVRFLNELIYYAEVKKSGGEILVSAVKKLKKKYCLRFKIERRKIKALGREVKAATYHNMKIEQEEGFLSVSLIFDV